MLYLSVTVGYLGVGREMEKLGASAVDLENARYSTPEQWGSKSRDTVTMNLGTGCRLDREEQ